MAVKNHKQFLELKHMHLPTCLDCNDGKNIWTTIQNNTNTVTSTKLEVNIPSLLTQNLKPVITPEPLF